MWSPDPAHCCCLPRWQWSGRLQPAGPHAVLSADTFSQLVNMFCKGKSLGKHCCNRAKHTSAHIFASLMSWCIIVSLLKAGNIDCIGLCQCTFLESAKTDHRLGDLSSLQGDFLPCYLAPVHCKTSPCWPHAKSFYGDFQFPSQRAGLKEEPLWLSYMFKGKKPKIKNGKVSKEATK